MRSPLFKITLIFFYPRGLHIWLWCKEGQWAHFQIWRFIRGPGEVTPWLVERNMQRKSRTLSPHVCESNGCVFLYSLVSSFVSSSTVSWEFGLLLFSFNNFKTHCVTLILPNYAALFIARYWRWNMDYSVLLCLGDNLCQAKWLISIYQTNKPSNRSNKINSLWESHILKWNIVLKAFVTHSRFDLRKTLVVINW